jgi:hypothetical protein
MKIALAADHGGFDMKEILTTRLRKAGHSVTDFGAATPNPEDDYPDYIISGSGVQRPRPLELSGPARRPGLPGAGSRRKSPRSVSSTPRWPGPPRANRRATSRSPAAGWTSRRDSPWPISASTPCTRMGRHPLFE